MWEGLLTRALVESELALALRELQKLDEVADLNGHRYMLIRAESHLGEILGLSCTGEPAIFAADGSVDGYDHDMGTCPIHEWLVPDDQREITNEAS